MLTLADISEKIESVRRQPENMRIRYVWGCVAVSMFIILILWFFSIASMFTKESNQTAATVVPSINEQLQTIKEQAPSLENLNNQSLPVDNTAATPTGSANVSNEVKSSVYSNLQNTNSSQ